MLATELPIARLSTSPETGIQEARSILPTGTKMPRQLNPEPLMHAIDIHIISGGTCRTARQVLRACLAQYQSPEAGATEVIEHRQVTEIEKVGEIVRRLNSKAIVCHTLVEPQIRQAATDLLRQRGIPCIDLLGPTMSVVGDYLAQSAAGQPGLLYELHREQFDRLDAVDFTMAHDDGNRLYNLDEADVVLTGVSRVSKSVTCFYLASRGIRAANVPLIPNQPPPPELLALESRRVYGLTMNAAHLASIRKSRLSRLTDREVQSYATIRELNREILAAQRLFTDQGWSTIDVSYMATEEVASLILDSMGEAG